MDKGEAIKVLNDARRDLLKASFWEETRMNINEAFDMAIEALARPEHEKSEWAVASDDSEAKCMRCNYKVYGKLYQGKYLITLPNFCPNCGAGTKGEGKA